MLTYIPLVLLVAAALALGAYYLTAFFVQVLIATGFGLYILLAIVIPFDLAVLLAIIFLLHGLIPLFFRNVIPQPDGERLDPKRHANLHSLVERLCRRLGVPAPNSYLLSPFDDTCIGDLDIEDHEGRVTRNVRTLVIGAAHVVHARVDELAILLCHEIAHAATGDTRLAKFVTRFYMSLYTQLIHQQPEDEEDRGWVRFFLELFLRGYYHVFNLSYLADCRYRELRADRIAAEVCGPQNTRNALIKLHLVAQLPQLSIYKLWIEYCENERDITNLYAEHRRRWESLNPQRRQQAENEMFMEPTSVWSSHPALADRVRNLADVSAKELTLGEPATKLFRHWEALEHQITGRLIRYGRAMHAAYLADLDRSIRVSQ